MKQLIISMTFNLLVIPRTTMAEKKHIFDKRNKIPITIVEIMVKSGVPFTMFKYTKALCEIKA